MRSKPTSILFLTANLYTFHFKDIDIAFLSQCLLLINNFGGEISESDM